MSQHPSFGSFPPGDGDGGGTAPVLLVDDDPNSLLSLSRRWRGRFQLVTADSGAAAVAAVEEGLRQGRPFAAVLCDMHMPGLNGLDTLARIRALSPDTVPVMLTGDSDQQTAVAAINQGNIFRFYTKPADPALLEAGLTAALRQNRLLRAERCLAENEARRRLALGRMAAAFAHEISTPIGVALSAVSDEMRGLMRLGAQLAEGGVDQGALGAELRALGRSGQLALAHLNRCADMAARFRRAFADQDQDPVLVYDLAEVIEAVRAGLRAQFKDLPVRQEIDCPPGLLIKGTPGPIEQVLTNLMLNALKHGFAGGSRAGTLRLAVERRDPGRLRLLFSDDGAGMPPEDAARVFEPFFTTARGGSGGGLGLFLCYNLVSAGLGGSISCDSAPGLGTRFLIEFPITLAADTQEGGDGLQPKG